MRKIGILCLALVLALGSLGVGYAAWTDTLTIEGTVATGTVDIDILGYSETLVYKTPNHGIAVVYQFHSFATNVTGNWHSIDGALPLISGVHAPGMGWQLIAHADVTEIDHETNKVTVAYKNLFPGPKFGVDLLLHYAGSIPARVNKIDFKPAGTAFVAALEADTILVGDEAWRFTFPAGTPTKGAVVDIGTQLHDCDFVGLVLWVQLTQEAPQGITGTATYKVEVVQWNKYPYAPKLP